MNDAENNNNNEDHDPCEHECTCSKYKIDDVFDTALLVAEGRTFKLRELKLIQDDTKEVKYCVEWGALDNWMNWEILNDKWFKTKEEMQEFCSKLRKNLNNTFEQGQLNLNGTVVYLTKRTISHSMNLIGQDDWADETDTTVDEYIERLEEDEEVFYDAFVEDTPCDEHFAEMMERKMSGEISNA